jgi:adenylyltransferase/sulfurtransferase
VNRQCWRTTTPWIDGGIQEINGVVKVFVPPDSACYECAMTDTDYQLINLRYSCLLLRREEVQAGKVPTATTISSMIGGLQTQEAIKLIHGLPVESGRAMVFNGIANRFYATRFQRREECLSHETYSELRETSLSAAGSTAADVFDILSQGQASDAPGPRRICLDRDLVVSLECAACDWTRPILQPLQRVSLDDARCLRCGQTAKPRLEHSITAGSPLAGERLLSLGIAPYDVVRIEAGEVRITALLAGDRETVLA